MLAIRGTPATPLSSGWLVAIALGAIVACIVTLVRRGRNRDVWALLVVAIVACAFAVARAQL